MIFGCEGFVTLEATLAAATLPIRFEEFMFEIAEPFEATSKPLTVKLVNVPTDVMFGCEGFVTLVATLAAATLPTRLEEFMFEIPEPLPLMRPLTSEFRFEIPETLRLVRVPTEVMFGWEGFVTLVATFAAATLPTRLDEFMFEIPEPFEATSNPLTVRPVSVPTEVMFG